ncbi:MAG: TrkA family potassium uptake protein [Marinifilaceae bacterium]
MKIKLKGRILVGIALVVYFLLLVALTNIEKHHPDASIKTIGDALWYSVVTLTTVGYGDSFPVTDQGKFLSLVIILGSLGLLGYLLGVLSNFIRNYMKKQKEGAFGTDFSRHAVIIGWDNFARLVVKQIVSANVKVAVVTNNREDLDQVKEFFPEDNVFCMLSSYDNYEAYEKLNIGSSISVFVNLPNDTETLVFILNLKKKYEDLKFVVSLDQPELKETFESIGVKHAVFKNDISSSLIASFVFEPDVANLTEDLIMTSKHKDDYDIQEYHVNAQNPFLDVDYIDAFVALKKDYNSVLLGIVKCQNGQRELLKNPASDVKIEEQDYLIIVSNELTNLNLEKVFGTKQGMHLNN